MFDGIRRQLRSVIEWNDPDPDVLFERWTDNGDEIKNASKLIVGPGQGCVFVYEGQVKAVINQEALVSLETANIPFWTTIRKYLQFFESEHKVGIYFFRRSKILDQKWGTAAVIKYEDPHYGFPVGLRAFGNYSFRIVDAGGFFANVVAAASSFQISTLRQVMAHRIVHPLADYLAEARFSYADIDANREEIGLGMRERLSADFDRLGFEITDFRIEGTSFDEDTIARINRIADVRAEALAASAAGLSYAELQRLGALRDAARNESGAAGAGIGVGAGIGLGQMMAESLSRPPSGESQSGQDSAATLQTLKELYQQGLITEAEYAEKRRQVLARL